MKKALAFRIIYKRIAPHHKIIAMRGTLSLRQLEAGWRNLISPSWFSMVLIEGKEQYCLKHKTSFLRRNEKIILYDIQGYILNEWLVKFTFTGITIHISESLSFIYHNNPLHGQFITPSGKITAAMISASSSRSLELNGMTFKHKDFESVIHFRCTEGTLYEAILIAYLLFSNPIQLGD